LNKNQKVFFPLEERIVLDAAALAVATDNINDDSQSYQDDSSIDANQNNDVKPLDNIAENVVPLTNNRIVIIDERSDPNSEIRNYLDNKNVSFHTIKADQDGVSEISNILNKYHGVETLDIISHGSEGSLQLGNSVLNNDTLNDYYQELSSWADNFSQTADIMIYGCDVASGVDGVHFIKTVSEITGTDIASSDDTTGKSGDWTLEHFLGEVESGLVIDSSADLDVDLKHKTKSGDSGKNDKPEVENIKVSTDHDTNVGIILEGTDDKPANQLKFSFIKLPDADEGEFKLNGNTIELGDEISYADRDDIIFDPANDFEGKAKAKYVATDADGLTSKYAKIYVEVDNDSHSKTKGGKNYKPEVEDIKVSTNYDTNVGITLEGSDDKPESELKFSFIELPDSSEGEFKLNGNTIGLGDEISYADRDDIIFDPAYDFDGKAKAKYVATDADGLTSKYAKIYVEVDEASGNIAPDAKNDNVVTYEDHSITIDVLANDQDANGDDIIIDSVASGSNGSTAIVNGSIVYTPNNGYSGTDTFTYSIKDGNGGNDTATVTVDVCPNPDLHFSDSFTIGLGEDYTFASDDPLYDAEDFISGEKYLVGVDLEDLNTPHNVSIDQNLIDNSTVTIHKGANGTNSLWFKGTSEDIQAALQTLKFTSASDNSSNDTIVVCLFKHIDGQGYKHIDINFIDANVDSSVLANDDSLKAYEDTALTITPSDILGNDIGNINIINYTQPSNGTISQDGNGNLVYTPNQDYNGPDSFTYTVSGQGGSYSNNLIVNGSFESDDVSGDWAVYPNGITGWQTSMGPGIEIQTGNIGGIAATDGDQKVELDSHYATDTNSNMYQDIDVSNSNDTVLLQFDYSARNSVNTSASSIIEIYWDSELVDTITASASGWNTYSYQLSTVGKDTSRLEFRATGTDDTLGGLIDNVKLLDSNPSTSTATVHIDVCPVNDAPVAVDDSATTNEDTPVTINVLANDDDVDGDTLTVTGVTQGQNGTVSIGSNGEVTYTPNDDYTGNDTFEYTVSDGNGGTHTGTVTVTVNPVNDAPVAIDDSATTNEDTPVTIDVLNNDTDADGDNLTVVNVTQGQNGTTSINNQGDVVYTPNPNFNGTDTFEYTITDGNETHTGTVTIEVCPVADHLQVNDDSYTENDGDNLTSELVTQEDTPLDIEVSDLLENDEGISILPDSAKFVIEATPTNGTLYLVNGQNLTQLNNGDKIDTDSSIRFVPDQGADGVDNFQYSIHSPYEGFDNIDDYQTPVTGSPNGNGMEAVEGSDPGEHEVSVSFVSKNAGFDNTLGYYIYDKSGNIIETDIIWNDISGPQSDSVIGNLSEGQYLGFFLAADGGDTALNGADQIRFVDENGQIANFNDASNGQSEFNLQYKNGNGDWTDYDGGTNKGVFHSNSAQLNPDNLEHVVTGKVDVQGQSQLQVTFEDLYVNSDWDASDLTFIVNVADQSSNVANVTINVENTNDAPIANTDNVTTLEDVAITIDALGNDTDSDGDALTITQADNGSNGTVNIVNNKLVYTPNNDFYGNDTFTYTITDGNGETSSASVNVNVLPINDAPIANPDNATTNEDTPVVIDVIANDTDIDGLNIELQSVNHGANGTVTIVGGKAVYTPNANFVGTDTFTYAVTDNNGGLATGTVTVTVNPINDAPVAVDDSATTDEDTPVTIDVLANDTDVDGDTLTVESVTDGSNGTTSIDVDGNIVYTPNADFTGTDTFEYTITDGNETHTGTVTVTVNPINDAPVANDDSATTDEDTPVTIDVLNNDTDVDGDTLTVESVTDGSNGTTSIDVDGNIVYTPNADFTGTDTFEYTITDGNETHTGTVTVTVNPVNDNPVANDDSAITNEDTAVTIDVLANDNDVDGDTILIDFATNGQNGTTTVVNNQVVYTPNPNFFGTDSFTTYVITDGQGGQAQANVTVEVLPINDDPVAVNDTAFTSEDIPVTIDVINNDTDIEGDTLELFSTNNGSNGTVSMVGGKAVYTPNAGFNGTDTFTYVVSDQNGGFDTGTVTVEVISTNEAPYANDDSALTVQGEARTINVLANDYDQDGTIVDVLAVDQPSNGTITINPNGSIVYNPNAGFVGVDTFTYRVIDNEQFTSLPAKVTVTVKPLTLPDLGPGGNDEDDKDGNNPQNTTFGTPSTLTNIGSYDPYGKISDFEYSDYALKLVLELPDVVKKSEGAQGFGIPQASFEHSNPNAKITYDALLADGTDLPSWMEFNSEEGTFRISPPQLPNENFEILVTAQDEEGNEAASTFTLILLDENNVAFLDENNNGENNGDDESADPSSPVDEAFEALLKEFNEVTEFKSSEGFTPFSKQLQNNLKTELDDRVLELIKNMYAA
jgi:VCBS repeat-containing protein